MAAGRLVSSNIPIELCFVKHRRGVHSGAVCAGAASSSDGTDERAGGGADIWAFARDGAQDVEVFFAAWLSSSSADPPAELEAYIAVIDQILELDKSIHRKQQHSVKRIFERLRDEHGYLGGYTVVKDYVREQKQRRKEMFVPLKHAPGGPRWILAKRTFISTECCSEHTSL